MAPRTRPRCLCGDAMRDRVETEWGSELRYFCDACGQEIGDSEGHFGVCGGEWCDVCADERDSRED